MLNGAFTAWNTQAETLEEVEARIHDGVSRENLVPRARGCVTFMQERFPALFASLGERPRILEIGPGVGYLLQAMKERFPRAELHGLDISVEMIDTAQKRLRRDGVSELASFHHYDGVTMPFPDQSFDLVYSYATLQHIPKPYVYSLFTEIQRVSKRCVLQFLHWDWLSSQEQSVPFRREVAMQVRQMSGHWHHFYDEIELQNIFQHVFHADFSIQKFDASIWIGATLPAANAAQLHQPARLTQ